MDRALFDFSGASTQGWTFGDWQKGPLGQVTPAPAGGLTVASPAGNGWFGAQLAPPVDIDGVKTLSYTLDGPRSDVIVALRVGPQRVWCQTTGLPTEAGARTVTVDLAPLLQGCDPKQTTQPEDLSDVRAVQIWFNEGTFTLGSVRVDG